MRVVAHDFRSRDIVGGDLALDFANTVNARDGAPQDWLDGYPRLLAWAARTGEFPAGLLPALDARARRRPAIAARALTRARHLRESVFEVFAALAKHRTPPAAALAELEGHWKEAIRASRLAPGPKAGEPVLSAREAALDAIRMEVALRAVRLLGDPPRSRLRICAGSDCAWLFLDTSRGGRRRWCDMATCGNLAKARRHSRRNRASVRARNRAARRS